MLSRAGFTSRRSLGTQLAEHGAVADHLRARVGPLDEPHLDHASVADTTIGRSDRVCGQIGRDHEHVEVRLDDRTAAGQRVGRRARGARDDDAVARVRVHVPLVHPRLEVEHAAGGDLLQHDVVEGERLGAVVPSRATQARREQRRAGRCSQRPSSAASTQASMSCGMTSVRKPSRPRLMPRSGTPSRATSRAA